LNHREFRDPGKAYRGVTLWMLNDKLDAKEISNQVTGFNDAGWGAMITRTFTGLRTKYLSDEWMGLQGEMIAAAKREGLKVWLQAGHMPSFVPDLDMALRHRVLVKKSPSEAAESDESMLLKAGDAVYYKKNLENVIDLLSPEAMRSYIYQAYEAPWLKRFGAEFGKTVEAIWVDEPHFRPPYLPYSDTFEDTFKQRWGYSLVANLPSLYAEVGDWQKVRHHYWRVVVDMLLSGYFASVGAWCEQHGVKFSGHLMGEDTLNAQIKWTGACMPCYEYFAVPGIDHLTASLEWPSGLPFFLTPKQVASAAHQLGKEEVLCEIYGVSSERLGFEERKRIANWMALLGINYRCYHGSFYSLRGMRKRIYVCHLSYQQPWWPDNRLISDYFARVSYTLRQGAFQADVLALHPVESGYAVYDANQEGGHDRVNEPPQIRALNNAFSTLTENLLKAHRGFDYGDELLMAKHGKTGRGKITVGQMSYKAVVLPSVITLRQTTVDMLKRFVASGGHVIAAGDLPTRVDGIASRALQSLTSKMQRVENTPQAIKQALDGLVEPSIEIDGAGAENVWVHERRDRGLRAFYMINTSSDQSVRAKITIHGAGALEYWDLASGAKTAFGQKPGQGCVNTELDFAPLASHLLVLKAGKTSPQTPIVRWATTEKRVLAGEYAIRRHTPNVLTLDFCRARRGDGPWTETMPVIALQDVLEREKYQGPLTQQFHFRAERKPRRLNVVIEDAAEYTVTLNGQTFRYQGLPYFVDKDFLPVDVSAAVKRGENVLELTRQFTPPVRSSAALGRLFHTFSGVELEQIYLTGDFAVKSTVSSGEARERVTRLDPTFALTAEPKTCTGELLAAGYPFFVGRLSLVNTLDLRQAKTGERVFLTLPNLDAALAKVRVNGKKAGAILWQPYELDITSMVKDGANKIEIEYVTSLRNMIGPYHRSEGEPDDTWAGAFAGYDSRGGDSGYAGRMDIGPVWTNDYFVLNFGLQGKAAVEYRAAKA
jgi:hypothetical protein